MNGSSFSELLSHPEKPLQVHLEGVSALCKDTISKKKLDFPKIDNRTLEDTAYILGVCHDFGKATRFFQEYIRETDERRKRSLKNKARTNHGLISAVFTYFVLREYLKDKSGDFWYLPVFGFLAVKRHHGNLKNPAIELSDLDEDSLEILLEQVNAIEQSQIEDVYSTFLSWVDVKDFSEQIEVIVRDIKRSRRELTKYLESEDSPLLYLLFQILYSTLINSDKTEASGLIPSNRAELSPILVDDFKRMKGWDKSDGVINNIRNTIYNDVIGNIENLDMRNRIYSLNVPTGTGKTLTSLSLALKLRDKIKNQHGFEPKIIYSLPFLSVIDQNFAVFEDVFKAVYGQVPLTEVLLKHHHLSDIFYSTEDDEFEEDQALFLIEGWNSEIIVTTFIQLFHTVISNKNRALRKFHNIANSIIILDEVQSIPHEYWLLIKEVISAISRHFNTYFIFVTATQPLIFDEHKNEILNLVKNKNSYFEQFDRIELQYIPDPMYIGEFKEYVRENIEKYLDKDFLIVLNTINSTIELYQYLISQKSDETGYYYLSTSITPKERLERIRAIKESDSRKVIVSTQLIEAGVDIDVDVVYRDLAPLDSINQVAGRCNRNYRDRKKGTVKIFTLKDNRTEYHKYIYSGFLIDKTKEVLEGTNIVQENQFLDLNNKYFQNVKDTQSKDNSKKLLEYINNLRFGSLNEDFHLIKNEYAKTDVFIEIDDAAREIWRKYQNIREIKNSIKRKNEFLGIKKQFYEYMISIPKAKAQSLVDADTGIGYVSHEELESWYDKETGFVSGEGRVLIF
ncbi:MAG TPA: CRISPR-associated helicase Cas3' [Thermotogaceae bacterium]|nr:CRISPR-associated helicase Cas3' [Thermotogaceae bacterium]